MNKFVKWTSLMSMVGVIFLSSGCSCSVKQDKIDASADAIKAKKVFMNGNEFVDFTTNLKITEISNGVEKIKTIVVKRDIEGKKDVYEYNVKVNEGEGVQDVVTESQEVYVDSVDGKVYIKEINDNINPPYMTNYIDPSAVFMDTATLADDEKLSVNYYEFSEGFHELYKYVPYNGCSSASKDADSGKSIREQLPNIASSTVNTVACEVEKKLFKKDYTYTLFYRISFDYLRNITIISDAENRIASIRVEDSIAKPEGKIDKIISEFTISYGDVKN